MSLGLTKLDDIITHLVSNRNLRKSGDAGVGPSKHKKSSIDQIVGAHQKISDPIPTRSYHLHSHYDSQIMYLIDLITKMSTLVIIAVIGSIISVIGNIYIELHYQSHTHNMLIFILPVIDMVTTSICLL
eukprot:UN10652